MKTILARKKIGLKQSRSRAGNAIIFLMLGIVAVFMGLPFVFSIVQSLKPMEELFLFPPRFFVRNPTLDNFYQLSQLTGNLWVPIGRYVFNSVFVSVAGTFFHVILSSMAAYPLAKQKFPGSKTMFRIIIWSLLFSYEVTAIPRYVIMAKAGMINTYWPLILPPIAAPLGLFLMRQFMTQVPDSIIESATIDGAGRFRTYWSIVMPTVKPAWLTLVIFSFQSIWNRQGLEFIYNEALKVLPTALNQIAAAGIARTGVGAAASVVLMVPPIVTFIIVQSNVLQTMAHSGIKE
jgi:putative chitobiose transport system permease protein